MDATDKKIAEFLDLLEERTINPIDANVKINESCTATLLLIFAVIDSLSKITCDDAEFTLGNRVRFEIFLENIMGGSYAQFKGKLYELRCDIVHTGINAKVVLSKDKHASHLKEANGYLWIDTSHFLDDLKETLRQIRQSIGARGKHFQNAANRLQEFDIIDVDPDTMPSPGPDVAPFTR